MELKKGPSPWLAPVIAVTTLALTVFWIYLQIRHWKEPNADYMAAATNIIITALLWITLIVAIWRNISSARKTRRGPQTNTADQPLIIARARWGIGGDAYKDVTDIVRNHAQPDSLHIPASVGLFGDPYPGAAKELRVTYLIARQWEVLVPDGKTLILPEKEGEEQSRKEMQVMRAKLDALRGGAMDALLASGISDAEYASFMRIKQRFLSLRLCDKVALKRLCDAGEMSSRDLQISLSSAGFADPAKSVGQLIYDGLVEEIVGGRLRPKEARCIDALLKDNPIQI